MYKVRKVAWDLKTGDVVRSPKSGAEDVVVTARRLYFDGELSGVQYRQCPMVRIEYAGPPPVCAVVPGDAVFTVVRRPGVKA